MRERDVAEFLIGMMEGEPEEWYCEGARTYHRPTDLYVCQKFESGIALYSRDVTLANDPRTFKFGWWHSRRVKKAIRSLHRKLAIIRMKKRSD